MKMKYLIIVATLLFLPLTNAYAKSKFTEADRVRAVNGATAQATGIANNAQSGTQTSLANYQSLEQSSKDTLDNSQKGQSTAQIMQVGMYAMGAMYASSCPGSPASCVQAGVMFLMGSQAGKSADSFQNPIDTAWDNTCTYSSLGCGSTPENPYTAALTPGVIDTGKMNSDSNKILSGLSKGGYEVDISSGKIKTPNGEVNGNDPASVSSAIGSEAASALMSKVSDLEKDALKKLEQVSTRAVTAALGLEGGMGGGSSGSLSEGYDGESQGSIAAGASKLKSLRNPAKANGLTKNFNGEPIGVASDSIFEMMSRRYQLKNKQKTFFGAEVQ